LIFFILNALFSSFLSQIDLNLIIDSKNHKKDKYFLIKTHDFATA